MESLVDSLNACESLLRSVGEEFWADKLLEVMENRASDAQNRMIEAILSLYGGGGSFNDLIISNENGHTVDPIDEDRLNERLAKLRADLYQHASRSRRSDVPASF